MLGTEFRALLGLQVKQRTNRNAKQESKATHSSSYGVTCQQVSTMAWRNELRTFLPKQKIKIEPSKRVVIHTCNKRPPMTNEDL